MKLDGPKAGQNLDRDEDEEDDFYEAANALPMREHGLSFGLQRSDWALVLSR